MMVATVHVLQNDRGGGELRAARHVVCNTSTAAARMLIYIVLRKGDTARAVQMLKDQRGRTPKLPRHHDTDTTTTTGRQRLYCTPAELDARSAGPISTHLLPAHERVRAP